MNKRLCISRDGVDNGAMLCSLFPTNGIFWHVLKSAKVMSMLIPADQFLSINPSDKQESMIQCSVASIAKSPTDSV